MKVGNWAMSMVDLMVVPMAAELVDKMEAMTVGKMVVKLVEQ